MEKASVRFASKTQKCPFCSRSTRFDNWCANHCSQTAPELQPLQPGHPFPNQALCPVRASCLLSSHIVCAFVDLFSLDNFPVFIFTKSK